MQGVVGWLQSDAERCRPVAEWCRAAVGWLPSGAGRLSVGCWLVAEWCRVVSGGRRGNRRTQYQGGRFRLPLEGGL